MNLCDLPIGFRFDYGGRMHTISGDCLGRDGDLQAVIATRDDGETVRFNPYHWVPKSDLS